MGRQQTKAIIFKDNNLAMHTLSEENWISSNYNNIKALRYHKADSKIMKPTDTAIGYFNTTSHTSIPQATKSSR